MSVSFLLEAEPPRAPPTDQSSHQRRRCRPRGPDGCFGVFGLPVLPPVLAGPLLWPEVVQRSAWDPAGLKGAKHLWESRAEEETRSAPDKRAACCPTSELGDVQQQPSGAQMDAADDAPRPERPPVHGGELVLGGHQWTGGQSLSLLRLWKGSDPPEGPESAVKP